MMESVTLSKKENMADEILEKFKTTFEKMLEDNNIFGNIPEEEKRKIKKIIIDLINDVPLELLKRLILEYMKDSENKKVIMELIKEMSNSIDINKYKEEFNLLIKVSSYKRLENPRFVLNNIFYNIFYIIYLPYFAEFDEVGIKIGCDEFEKFKIKLNLLIEKFFSDPIIRVYKSIYNDLKNEKISISKKTIISLRDIEKLIFIKKFIEKPPRNINELREFINYYINNSLFFKLFKLCKKDQDFFSEVIYIINNIIIFYIIFKTHEKYKNLEIDKFKDNYLALLLKTAIDERLSSYDEINKILNISFFKKIKNKTYKRKEICCHILPDGYYIIDPKEQILSLIISLFVSWKYIIFDKNKKEEFEKLRKSNKILDVNSYINVKIKNL